jgi:DNA repair protein RAD7
MYQSELDNCSLSHKKKHSDKPNISSSVYDLCSCKKQIGNEALYSILDHSARTLQYLNLNSVDELRAEALERLAKETIHLEYLDISFVRDVDDFIIKFSSTFLSCLSFPNLQAVFFLINVDFFCWISDRSLLDHMKHLKSLSVYGNNRVSDLCPMKKGVVIKGQERSIVVT